MIHSGQIRNVTEELVLMQVETMRSQLPCCTCDQCLLDVAALALNKLPPKYVVSQRGALFSKLNACTPQQSADISAAVMHAAVLVANRPRHTPLSRQEQISTLLQNEQE